MLYITRTIRLEWLLSGCHWMQFSKLFQRITCSAQPTRQNKTSSQSILTKDRIAGAPHEKCPFPWGDPGRAITSLQASSDSSPVSEQPRTTVSVEHCIPVSSADTRRHLRSANRLLVAVPRFRLNKYGPRAFSVAGPMAWNSLPRTA